MQVGIRTKDRWPQLACLLSRLVGEPVDRLILADQSTTLPPAHVVALLSLFREVVHLHLPVEPIWAQRKLFEVAGSEGVLVQFDDDVLPVSQFPALYLARSVEKAGSLVFAMGCTQEVGRPAPADSPDDGFPNYLRWHSCPEPMSLCPCGIAFSFTGIKLSIVSELEAWLEDNVAWKALLAHQAAQLNDTPYGVAAEALGYRAEVLPHVLGYHVRPEGGEDTIFSRNAARGRVIADLLADHAAPGVVGQSRKVTLPEHVVKFLGVEPGDALHFHCSKRHGVQVMNVQQYEEILRPGE